jgi:hypothetical protein
MWAIISSRCFWHDFAFIAISLSESVKSMGSDMFDDAMELLD